MESLEFSCNCGEVRGYIHKERAADVAHIRCHCNDCRAGFRALDKEPESVQGVDILHTTADKIEFTSGIDSLKVLRISPRGLLRWYAGCCDTPLCATSAMKRLPFVGVIAENVPGDHGPLETEAFIQKPGSKPAHKGGGRFAMGLFLRMGRAWVTGGWRESPFFEEDGSIRSSEVRMLTRKERADFTKRS